MHGEAAAGLGIGGSALQAAGRVPLTEHCCCLRTDDAYGADNGCEYPVARNGKLLECRLLVMAATCFACANAGVATGLHTRDDIRMTTVYVCCRIF